VPHRNLQLRIADIVEAIETVLDYSSGMTFEEFNTDRKTIDAIIRNFLRSAIKTPAETKQNYGKVSKPSAWAARLSLSS
jgi:uncharacterized protein with HEPN domain